MKLSGQILQCVDGYRAGKVYALVDEVHASRTDRRKYAPAWPRLENARRNRAAPHYEKRLRRPGNNGLHTDGRPLLIEIVGDGTSSGCLNDVGDERPFSNCDYRIVGDRHENADYGSAFDGCPHGVDALLQSRNQSGSLRLAAQGVSQADEWCR